MPFDTFQMTSEPMYWLPLVGAFLAGAFICAMILLIWRLRARRREEEDDSGLSPTLPLVHWLDSEHSPTGRRVLDCRAVAMGVQLMTPQPDILDQFIEVTQSDGTELDGSSPPKAWLADVEWQFTHEEAEQLEEGMTPQVTEDLWRIDCRGSRLYFRRSWTGQLVFMANYKRIPTAGASITRLWLPGEEPFDNQSPEYMSAYVRHLIDTHLLNVATPFPIPPDFPDDKQKIAALVFYSVGRRGWLAEYFGSNQ